MIAIIAAYADNRVIGYQGRIPWHISEDFRHFREITAGGTVIMGRKTYESIGHPLPGRENIVVSGSMAPAETSLRLARNLTEALELATRKRIFIIGGESLYREGLAYTDTLYLTEIDGSFPGDKHFPELPEGEFRLISSEEHKVNKAEKVERAVPAEKVVKAEHAEGAERAKRAEQVEKVKQAKQAEKAEGELTFRFLEYRRVEASE
jgi:dihydrofolate reductase